jgi:carbon-monoxide dehydrogenase iron sulfur subunit
MRIKVNPDNCTGCRLCRQICTLGHLKEINPSKGRLHIDAKFPDPGKFKPYVCVQCGTCKKVCPEEAIFRNEETGAYTVIPEKCTNCGICAENCPQQVIVHRDDMSNVLICDFCMECTEVCNTEAIVKWDVMKPPFRKEV